MAEEARVFGMPAEKGRWIFVVLGFIINLCLGSVYAYSVFNVPVRNLFNIGAFDSGLPFMVFLAFFAGIFPFSGRLLEKVGPRKLGVIGGVIVGLGWILSGILPSMIPNIWTLIITYGVIAGSGVGLAYSGPIQVATRWFPDKKGLAVGLTVAGFGGSPFVSAYVAKALIDSVTVLPTFLYLGIAFLLLIILLSIPLKFPVAGWKPAGWTPKAGAAVASADYDSSQMTKTSSFWGLFICFTIGSLAGLMAISISSPVATGIIKLDSAVAAILVSVFAIFNGGGRPLFGWITDRITPRYAAILSFVIILLASIGMMFAGPGTTVLYVVCFAGFWLCLGGWLAIAPTSTATFFGIKFNARNYGIMLLAYGIGAILANFTCGFASDLFGSYLRAFIPVGVLAFAGLFIAFFLMKPPKKIS
ncbi:MAG: OFA family MFS transporter [Dehalococcoidia bacterium]|nr:OFA family MFS transporter [Dehalococcoidia bacterium]